jgi:hypothetical protein
MFMPAKAVNLNQSYIINNASNTAKRLDSMGSQKRAKAVKGGLNSIMADITTSELLSTNYQQRPRRQQSGQKQTFSSTNKSLN